MAAAARRHWLLILGVLSLVALVLAVDPGALKEALAGIEPVPALLMLPVTVASYVFRALGWRAALRHIGVPIGRRRAIEVMIAGQVLIFLPTGDLGRVALVEETGAGGHGAGEVAGTITFQELSYMAIMGLAVVPVVATHPVYLGALLPLVALLAAILVLLAWRPAFARALRVAEHIAPLQRFHMDVEELRTTFLRMFSPRVAATVLLYGALAAAASLLLFELALLAVGVEGVGLVDVAFIFALGHVLGAASMLPGGLGAYEGVLTGFMALHGVPPSVGAAAALVYRAFNDLAMALLGALVGLDLRHRWPRGRPEGGPSGAGTPAPPPARRPRPEMTKAGDAGPASPARPRVG